jgi:hypothetical protein
VWELPPGLPLDVRPETVTGPGTTRRPPSSIASCATPRPDRPAHQPHPRPPAVRAPRRVLRLAITFRRSATSPRADGRPILDAFVMLLSPRRAGSASRPSTAARAPRPSSREAARPTSPTSSPTRSSTPSTSCSRLRGRRRARRAPSPPPGREGPARGPDHVYAGLLTFLLRLVFVLYAEDRGLLPVDDPISTPSTYSVLGLYDQLQADPARTPTPWTAASAPGPACWPLPRDLLRRVTTARCLMPPRRGELFDPTLPLPRGPPRTRGPRPRRSRRPRRRPGPGRRRRAPSIACCDGLLFLLGARQRLSYRALDVEQIGSVYEA